MHQPSTEIRQAMGKRNRNTHNRLWCKFCGWSCPRTLDRKGSRLFGHAGMLAHVRQEHAEQYETIQRHLHDEFDVFNSVRLN